MEKASSEVALLPKVRMESAAEVKSGTRVMVLEAGLLYAGTVQLVDKDALVYSVQMDGQRSSNQPILCLEELLGSALKEVPVADVASLRPVGRIAAFWSNQLPALYPGVFQGTRTLLCHLSSSQHAQQK